MLAFFILSFVNKSFRLCHHFVKAVWASFLEVAVVADAVRTLAQRSASAAKEINKLISTRVTQVTQGTTEWCRFATDLAED